MLKWFYLEILAERTIQLDCSEDMIAYLPWLATANILTQYSMYVTTQYSMYVSTQYSMYVTTYYSMYVPTQYAMYVSTQYSVYVSTQYAMCVSTSLTRRSYLSYIRDIDCTIIINIIMQVKQFRNVTNSSTIIHRRHTYFVSENATIFSVSSTLVSEIMNVMCFLTNGPTPASFSFIFVFSNTH